MQFTVRKGDILQEKCDLLAINALEGSKADPLVAALDGATGGLVSAVMKEEHFEAKSPETLLIRPPVGFPAKRILVVGMGKKGELKEETVRQAAAVTANAARALRVKMVVSVLHGLEVDELHPKVCGKAMAEGALLAAYEFAKYKSKADERPPVEAFHIVLPDGKQVRPATEGVAMGEAYARATILARDLVNEPPRDMCPAELLAAAKAVATQSGGAVKVKAFGREQLQKMGAGGVLGIARGSDHEPFLVHMTYKPASAKKRVALVGKAITFDSGGISIKPSDAMMTMKCDMAGAAAVIGAFSALSTLKPRLEVHGVFAACENMPSGRAIVPGDVVRAMNGKTIEVLNTDAEGRVTLADAMTYALRQKPDMMLDLATLTGACVVALGEEVAGVMANDPAVARRVLDASKQAGEHMWELPLEQRYKRLLKSEVADLKNIAGKYGGALTAGLFLEEFAGGIPWAHLDIAGPSFAEKPLNPYTRHGGTGYGVRTLLEFIRSF
ncbi:leucyl aminopeptidase [Candidatus Uhrbacteria bacterium]|nr:leucyl aminopeptidase [Candidatus Uhrbacteria bacterium]